MEVFYSEQYSQVDWYPTEIEPVPWFVCPENWPTEIARCFWLFLAVMQTQRDRSIQWQKISDVDEQQFSAKEPKVALKLGSANMPNQKSPRADAASQTQLEDQADALRINPFLLQRPKEQVMTTTKPSSKEY